MSYEPRGHAQKIIEAMRATSSDFEWPAGELCEIVSIKPANLAQAMRPLISNGLAFRQCRGRKGTFYSLTPYEQEQAQEEAVEFNAAHYLDGDLVIWGAQVNEDGSITLKKDQLVQIKRLVTWSALP